MNKKRRRYAYGTSLATLIVFGLVLYQYPSTQPAYAHTFSGSENAGFIATVGVIRTEIRLIDNTLATNASLANEHANFAVEHLSENDTKELSEKNERIGTDLPQYLSDLQNMTANLSSTNMTGITAIKQKVSDTDALLGEALTARIEPTQLRNATVNAWAVADLLNETLERFGEAIGIAENSSNSSAAADGNNNSEVSTNTNTATDNASMSNNTSTIIVNYAEYQSTQGLVNMTKEILNEIKSLLGRNSSTAISADSSTNATTTTTATTMENAATTTTNSSAISKVDNDLNELESLIDNNSSYTQVATFVYGTIYPDLDSAFGLGLEKVNVTEAIEEARSGVEEEG
jgi:hypothetical protein